MWYSLDVFQVHVLQKLRITIFLLNQCASHKYLAHCAIAFEVKMKSYKVSYQSIFQEIIHFYSTLLQQKVPKQNYIIDTINYLKDFENRNSLLEGKVKYQEIYHFLKLLLDMVGLINATEGSFRPFKLGDTMRIGSKKDLMGVYKGNDNVIDQNMCAILFKGWFKGTELAVKFGNDLKYIVKNGKACDYSFEDGKVLIECKRVHYDKISNDLIESIVKKLLYWIGESISQFSNTESELKYNNNYRHLIMDISAYGKECSNDLGDQIEVIGLLESKQIKQIITELRRCALPEIDEITLCWLELYVFYKKPRVFVYRTASIKINEEYVNLFDYKGYTIEFYPSGNETMNFNELRISRIARSHAWIIASWYSCANKLSTIGAVEEHQ